MNTKIEHDLIRVEVTVRGKTLKFDRTDEFSLFDLLWLLRNKNYISLQEYRDATYLYSDSRSDDEALQRIMTNLPQFEVTLFEN